MAVQAKTFKGYRVRPGSLGELQAFAIENEKQPSSHSLWVWTREVAKSIQTAGETCAQFSETPGQWRLPAVIEYLLLLGSFPEELKVSMNPKQGPPSLYPAWLQPDFKFFSDDARLPSASALYVEEPLGQDTVLPPTEKVLDFSEEAQIQREREMQRLNQAIGEMSQRTDDPQTLELLHAIVLKRNELRTLMSLIGTGLRVACAQGILLPRPLTKHLH